MKELTYDVAVIGGGSAGYAAGRSCAAQGLRTAIIEGAEEVGGLCILRGCMPTKALLYSAEVAHLARHAATFGVFTKDVQVDYSFVKARKERLIADFAGYRRKQLETGKFEFIRSRATFEDPHTLILQDGRKLRAKNFILATGSVTSKSPLPQLDEVGYITSDEALALEKLPASLIVLGGGAIALEGGQFFNRMGTKVTIIQRSKTFLKEDDEDGVVQLENALKREGITIFTDTQLMGASLEGGLKVVEFSHRGQTVRVAAEEILYALGRSPNVEGLGLDRAGVAVEYGRFLTNSFMQTSAPHIFAAGDCTGLHEIVHIAIQQGEIAAHNIVNPDNMRAIDYRLMISVIFTDPQVSRVGLTEKEALAKKIPYLAAKYPFNDHGKSMIMEALDGFVKLLAHPETGEILGGSCIGPFGGDLLHEIVVAMSKRMTVHELATVPHYHPTLAEIWTYPAEELADQIKV
ncbi:MAG TPA: NAD(P)/FAD-dependent oxidoreductase [Methylomirabilota bacterium]|nr:NAD(P)/FAD-dependent oxidoreductase [Methylomirabilota bacterium]